MVGRASALRAVFMCLASLSFPAAVLAQPTESSEAAATDTPSEADIAEARRLFTEGRAHFDASEFAEAERAFRRSLALAPRATTAFNLASVAQRIGHALAALDVVRALEAGEYGAIGTLEVAALRSEAEASLGTVRVSVTHSGERPVSGIEILVDGDRCARLEQRGVASCRVDPGDHVVRATAVDHQDGREAVVVTPGGEAAVGFHLRALDDARPGVLTVESLPDAQIQVEGYGTGTGSLRLELAPQRYRVRVSGGGNSQTSRVDVPAGRAVRLYLEPRVTPIYESPWLWVAIGLVLAGGGVAIGWAATTLEGPTSAGSIEILREALP
ncbi:MAG: hypothetical protein AB8I08_20600 [Sandaracinaceae bacterium]